MGNKWAYCNPILCAEYKSIWYQLEKYSGGYEALNKIEEEFKENRASQTLNDWLSSNSESLRLFVMDAAHDHFNHSRKRNASEPILLWAEILESYLKFKHDTPSCVQLWKWAVQGHREQKITENALATLNIKLEGDVLHIGATYRTTKKTYDKLFERHIGTQSIYPDSKQRKHEKLMKDWERSVHEYNKKKV